MDESVRNIFLKDQPVNTLFGSAMNAIGLSREKVANFLATRRNILTGEIEQKEPGWFERGIANALPYETSATGMAMNFGGGIKRVGSPKPSMPEGGNQFKKSSVKNQVYHGSKMGVLSHFEENKYEGHLGVAYFTDSKDIAKAFGEGREPIPGKNVESWEKGFHDLTGEGGKGDVVNAYIDIRKPITDKTTLKEVFGSSQKAEEFVSRIEDELGARPFSTSMEEGSDIWFLAHAYAEFPEFRKFIKSKGYDGWIWKDVEAGGTTYVPMNSSQIKLLPNPSSSLRGDNE